MKKVLFVLVIIFIAIQFIPVERTNPSVSYEVKWDSKQTLDYAKRACYDCHSNETNWPWYSRIAPASWLLVYDVNEGREHLNFSTGSLRNADESVEEMLEEHMPPEIYLIMHPEAKLADQEKQLFINGLTKTFGNSKVEANRK